MLQRKIKQETKMRGIGGRQILENNGQWKPLKKKVKFEKQLKVFREWAMVVSENGQKKKS